MQNTWTDGYVADIGYTYGYYQELNPLRIKLAFMSAGLAFPEIGTACELGFGQGLSTNCHAAGSTTEWWGTDFNPAQASFAQALAAAAGTNTQLFDQAFSEFVHRKDLPDFDFIALHGIWSWISDENRAHIVNFLKHKLKVGGVLYISYNALPGWASAAPLRHLMTQHAAVMGSKGVGVVSRINSALEFSEKLLSSNPTYLRANPSIADKFAAIKTQNKQYLAHEYFNRDWEPMYFSTIAEWLEPAKISYACSAHYLDHVDAINLTEDQLAILHSIPNKMYRETIRDYMVNQQFRRDYWVKGERNLAPLEKREVVQDMRFVLTSHRQDVPSKISGTLGECTLQEEIYAPLLDAMAGHKPMSIAQLESVVSGTGVSLAQVIQAILLLTGASHTSAVQDPHVTSKAKKQTERLNAHLMKRARYASETLSLASPVTGGAITVGRFNQLYLLAYKEGRKEPEDWAKHAWNLLSAQDQRLVKDGKTLESAEDNIQELSRQAQEFALKQLPILKALQVI